MKHSAKHVEQELGENIKDIHETTVNIKEDLKDGLRETKKDIHKTMKNMKKEVGKL